MKNLIALGVLAITFCALQGQAKAERLFGRWASQHASSQPWHGQYYYLQYGQPTALVVPPNAVMQQNYSWGVSQNTMTPIHHSYGPMGMPSAGGAFYGTPIWPSNTGQFGVYPVRAPR